MSNQKFSDLGEQYHNEYDSDFDNDFDEDDGENNLRSKNVTDFRKPEHNFARNKHESVGETISVLRKHVNRSNTTANDKIAEKLYTTETVKFLSCAPDAQPSSATISLEFMLEELIETEENYVKALKDGVLNYMCLFDEDSKFDLPKSLNGLKSVLFRNIEDILDFHENELLVMFHRNHNNLSKLFSDFTYFIENNSFYRHLMFNMHKKNAENILLKHKKFFEKKRKFLNDRLGIQSFLTQPVQRLTRYPMLLKRIMQHCFKNYEYKELVDSCCRLEKRVVDYVALLNTSETLQDIEECYQVNPYYQGFFRKMNTFCIFDYNLNREYYAQVFLFEKSIIFAEIIKKRLVYRDYYPIEKIAINRRNKYFTLTFDKKNIRDFKSRSTEIDTVWISLIEEMIFNFIQEQRLKSPQDNSHLIRRRFRTPYSTATFRNSIKLLEDEDLTEE